MSEHPARAVASLEAVLQSAQETVEQSLMLAEAMGRVHNSYAQDQALNRAIAFMKVSAKLGMALARIEGRHTTIAIKRSATEEAPAVSTAPAAPRLGDPAREARISEIVEGYRAAGAAQIEP